jgi:hypothetical protein
MSTLTKTFRLYRYLLQQANFFRCQILVDPNGLITDSATIMGKA